MGREFKNIFDPNKDYETVGPGQYNINKKDEKNIRYRTLSLKNYSDREYYYKRI